MSEVPLKSRALRGWGGGGRERSDGERRGEETGVNGQTMTRDSRPER